MEFSKCGEIAVAFGTGVRVYELNCVFCNEVYTQLEEFVMHVEIQHSDDLVLKAELVAEEQEQDIKFTPVEVEEIPAKLVHMVDADSIETIEEREEMEADFMEAHEEVEGFEEFDSISEPSADVEDVDDSEATDGITESICSTDEKVLTLAIILCYEKQRVLWDINDRRSHDPGRQDEAFEKITISINRQLGLHLDVADIKKKIKHLHQVYYTETENQRLALEKGDTYTMPWFFDKLRFLDMNDDYDNERNEARSSSYKKSAGLPLPNLTHKQHLEFFDIYQSFPCLWDINHIGFHTKKLRHEALEEMLLDINTKLQLDYTSNQLQRKLYDIRYTCTQEKQRMLKHEKEQKEYRPKCAYYEQIAFLIPHIHPFKCPYCDEMFTAPQPYNVHKHGHDGEKPFKCTICGHAFMTAGNCTVHLRRHTQDYPYACEVCGKKFPASSELTLHMRYHNGEKPYICEVCGQGFFRTSTLEYHMRRHRNIRGFKCNICSKAFFDNSQLKEHMHGHSNVRDKICNVCGKAFAHAKHLRQHKQIHAEKKKYKCVICEKDFAQYAGLSGHMKSHGTTISGLKDMKLE